MRILLVHNFYQTPGGEDGVFKSETDLLRDSGQKVKVYTRSNTEIAGYPFLKKIHHLLNLHFAESSYRDIAEIIKAFRPDVVHCHNMFFMVTPAVYHACRDANVPVVQSLHNFRPFCINGIFLRDHKPCEKCLKTSPWVSVMHRCYRGSFFLSACAARMNAINRRQEILSRHISAFITASEFGRKKLVECGIPAEKIFVKPNGIYPDIPCGKEPSGDYALYAGRLSEEKGVALLLEAWRRVPPGLRLKIMGDGPLLETFRDYAVKHGLTNVELAGFVGREEFQRVLGAAKFVIVPSRCYENFPRIVAEAYARKKAVVAGRIGSLAELIHDGKTGLLFNNEDAGDLAEKILWMAGHPREVEEMGQSACRLYRDKYHYQKIYRILMDVYENVTSKGRS